MVRLIMLRHGETKWNRDGLFRGRRDVELNETGLAQAEAAARAIWPWLVLPLTPAKIISSPLARASATAQALQTVSGLPMSTDEGLSDLDYGALEGCTVEEAEKRFPGVYLTWRADPAAVVFPGGESLQEAAGRIETFLAREFLTLKEGCVIAVSHRVPIKLMIMSLLGLPLSAFWRLRVDNASISVAEHDGKGLPVLVSMNDTNHLKLQPPVTKDF
ncbi:MAG TPA: histidine phosphatase family protein [Firmicutes bacterium]|nr:histidine phosphatase family protein [Bacillota bacterium]